MKEGDLVVCPSKQDRKINIGQITGDYFHDPKGDGYPNQRPVKWLKTVPRLQFSKGALYETGSALSLFQIKNYADEFRAVLEGKKEFAVPVKEDPTVSRVQSDIEKPTRNFIIKALAQKWKAHTFADFLGHLLNRIGCRTRISPKGADGGVDIIA